jgi:Sulfotransferase family
MTQTETSLVEQPIFLVGAERSGTTVLRLMLSHHPQLAWCQEFEYAVERISDDGSCPKLDEYYDWLETNRVFRARDLAVDRSLSYPQLVDSFLRQQRDRQGKKLVGATVHRHFDRLLAIWSDARFIHLVRDGRDVARSNIGMGWAGNIWTGVERWLEAERLWERVKAKIGSERSIEIAYEDLIADPVATLTKICQLIGIPYDRAMLDYPQSTTYQAPDANLVSQWRRKLSESEIRLVESRISDLLTARGYELSGLPPMTVTANAIARLKLQDWWARVQFRIKRNGISLVLSDYLSRRLGFKQLQKRVKLKLNAIETSYLK